MASPSPSTMRKDKKDDSFLDKIGTTQKKKKQTKEALELEAEGIRAIESPTSPVAIELDPNECDLEEGDMRSMVHPQARDNAKLKELIQMLLKWINDELAENRILVKDLEEDLFDGQILQKLIEKLANTKVEVPEVSQTEEGQKQKLQIVLNFVNSILQVDRQPQLRERWNVESIHSKSLVAILHLLVALATHFSAPIRPPENVIVKVVVIQKRDGLLQKHLVIEEITGSADDMSVNFGDRDAFDTLYDHAPDKLNVVKQSLVGFVNLHLNKINLEVSDLDSQFHDGVYLVLLMGLLEGYFVPLYCFSLTPTTFEQKVQNVSLSFELMQDAGLNRPRARPEDIVNQHVKSILRVLFNLFTKYKSVR